MVQQLVAPIPWGDNSVLLEKLDDPADALFYVQKTIQDNWSRAVLTHQIESGLRSMGEAKNRFRYLQLKHGGTEDAESNRILCALRASVFTLLPRVT